MARDATANASRQEPAGITLGQNSAATLASSWAGMDRWPWGATVMISSNSGPTKAKAPWLFNGETFLSYNDEQSIAEKAAYVNREGLLGAMYWEYGLDTTFTLTGCLRRALDQ